MAERKSFLLRIDQGVFDALNRWANDEFRSLNGHLDYLLHQALKKAGRLPKDRLPDSPSTTPPADAPSPGWGEDA